MKYDRYVPENQEQFDEMYKWFSGAETREDLAQRMMLYVVSPQYARQDIIVAEGRVAEEKGFRTI